MDCPPHPENIVSIQLSLKGFMGYKYLQKMNLSFFSFPVSRGAGPKGRQL